MRANKCNTHPQSVLRARPRHYTVGSPPAPPRGGSSPSSPALGLQVPVELGVQALEVFQRVLLVQDRFRDVRGEVKVDQVPSPLVNLRPVSVPPAARVARLPPLGLQFGPGWQPMEMVGEG